MRRVRQCWRMGSDTPAPAKVRQCVGRSKLVSIYTRAGAKGAGVEGLPVYSVKFLIFEVWQ